MELFAVGVFTLLPHDVARHGIRISAQQNIRTAAGHVGGNGYGTLAPRLRHDMRFALVVLGVQNFVPYACLLEQGRKALRLFDRDRPDQNRLPAFLISLDFLGCITEFLVFRAIDDVLILLANHGAIGRNHGHVELVDLLELGRFCFRGTRHAGQFLVHAEVILERDGGERLIFPLDLHAFLRFHRLVQSIAPAPSRHQAAGELIDDDAPRRPSRRSLCPAGKRREP